MASQQASFVSCPLTLLAACLASGVAIACFFKLPLQITLMAAIILVALTVTLLLMRKLGAATTALFLAFFCIGAALLNVERKALRADSIEKLFETHAISTGDPVELTGALVATPEPAPEGFYITLNLERVRIGEDERVASGRVLLFASATRPLLLSEYSALELRYGARVRVMTRLEREEDYRNPGVEPFTEYLERRGVAATATIKSPLLFERLDDERVFLPVAWVYEWRQEALTEINRRFSTETAGVLDAALLGDRYFLSKSSAERFREGGTFHVLVISGLHISFIGGLAFLLAKMLTKRRLIQFALCTIFLWAYAVMVGAEASVMRAAFMFTVVALAPLLNRRAQSLNALGAAAIVLLVYRPSDLFDPSFQLTFLSVLMIVAAALPLLKKFQEIGAWRPTRSTPYPPACPRIVRTASEILFWDEKEWRREVARSVFSYRLFKTKWAARLRRAHLQLLLRYAASAVVISASVQLGLLPLLVLYFHRLSMASLLLNIWVGALMAALGLLALASLLLAQLSANAAAPFLALAELLSRLMTHSVDPFRAAHIAYFRLPQYTGWPSLIYAAYFLPLALLAILLARWTPLARADSSGKSRRRFAALIAVSLFTTFLIIIVLHPGSAQKTGGRLRVDFLDVGQGDSALLTMPDGTTILVDGGGRPPLNARRREESEEYETDAFERDTRGIGEAVVSEYLWHRGLDHVDYVLATHADADHIQGLNDVLKNFRVRAALVARAPAIDPEFREFARTAFDSGVPVYMIGRGDLFHFGAVTAEVLWPTRETSALAPSQNNDSIVLRLKFGERTFLLTGDIEREAEAALAAQPENLRCDIIKVAHHGSRTSSTQPFVNAARPNLAIISVGQQSPFGHPHREVVRRWQDSGAQILTTGRSGAITISTNGQDLRVETFVH